MGLESYRVRRKFNWDGWMYAPEGQCRCGCPPESECTGETGSGCAQCTNTDRCSCSIPPNRYAGDIWLVMEGHPRKETMLATRFAVSDPSLAPADELIKEEKYNRLLSLWTPPVYQKSTREKPTRVADPLEVA